MLRTFTVSLAIESPNFGFPAGRYLSARLELDRPMPAAGSADSARQVQTASVGVDFFDALGALTVSP